MSPGHTKMVSDDRTTLFTSAIPIFNLTKVLSDVTSKIVQEARAIKCKTPISKRTSAEPGLKLNATFQVSTEGYGYAQRSSDRTGIAFGTIKCASRASRAAPGCPMRQQAFARAGCP